jgi:hypothetical protein
MTDLHMHCLPVFHHPQCDAVAGWKAYYLWTGLQWNGYSQENREYTDRQAHRTVTSEDNCMPSLKRNRSAAHECCMEIHCEAYEMTSARV